MFCKGCGTKVTAAYCPGCGAVKAEEWTQINVDLVDEKYCSGCGKPVTAAFCGACGKQRKTAVTVGRASAFAGFGGAAAGGYAANSPGNAPVAGVPNLPVPVEVLLMGVMFLFALSTHSLLTGFALFFAVSSAFMAALLPKLYENVKGIVNVAAGGVALLLVILSLATADWGLNFVGFLFTTIVVLVIIFIGLRSLLNLKVPPVVENLMPFLEGPMYFHWVAVLFTLASLFRPTMIGWRFVEGSAWGLGEFYPMFSFSRFVWALIFTIILLTPILALAFFIWRKMTHLIKFAVAAMAVSGFLSLIFIPVIFRRLYLVPAGYIALGYLGILLAVLVVFLMKDYVMALLNASGTAAPPHPVGYAPQPGQPALMGGMPPQGGTHVPGAVPMGMLDTNRNLLTFILLSMITFGIYGIVKMCMISTDINTIASRYDGKNTMHYIIVVLLSPLTCSILMLVWHHSLADRLGMELRRRGIPFQISSTDFWLWGILGSFIIVGPFIYLHKMLTAMNLLSVDYNARG